MSEKLRLDKLLSHMGLGTRKDVRTLIKQGRVSVNGMTAKKPEQSIDPAADQILCCGQPVIYEPFIYLMMHKTAGYLSATEDMRDPTVMALLPEPYSKMELFIAGRLDKDTEGFLLLTNNGQFAHNMLSPKKHVPKTYYAKIDGLVTAEDAAAFAQGLTLEDGTLCQPAELTIVQAGAVSEILLTITEGKFHQVKRMFEAVGKSVTYLKRVQIGQLPLDETLPLGQVKKLSPADVALIGASLT